jgi:DNA polymerase-1
MPAPPASPAPLVAVDAPSLMYRAFFALPTSITDGQDRPVNALLGTTNLILQVVEQHRPRAVVMCWGPESAPYRTDAYPAYHADRPPMPDELRAQWDQAPAFFEALGWPSLDGGRPRGRRRPRRPGPAETAAGGRTLLFTGDRDMFQCVSDSVAVLFPSGSGRQGPAYIDADGVRERYGIEPEQVPDFIALRGDPSDGLPGAKGIGEKTAGELLRAHGDLESLITLAADPAAVTRKLLRPRQAAALAEQADELRSFRDIATLRPVDVERPPDRATDGAAGAAAARERGMLRLAERLEKVVG